MLLSAFGTRGAGFSLRLFLALNPTKFSVYALMLHTKYSVLFVFFVCLVGWLVSLFIYFIFFPCIVLIATALMLLLCKVPKYKIVCGASI